LNKQRVISTLLHIGAPKPEGYFPLRNQTATEKTTAAKDPVQNQAQKEAAPGGKGKAQGKS
jgi:hypothetical protein